MKASLLGEGQPLFQKGGGSVKGAYSPKTRAIELVKGKADVSTVIHEVAHDWHGFLVNHPTHGETVKRLYGDLSDVKGAERFAKDFERYLAAGKAPTSAMRKVFESLKRWMQEIYNSAFGKGIPKEAQAIFKSAYQSPSEETLRLIKEFEDFAHPKKKAPNSSNAPKVTTEPKPRGASMATRTMQADELGTRNPTSISGKTDKEVVEAGKKMIEDGYDVPTELRKKAQAGQPANEDEIGAIIVHRDRLIDDLEGLNKRLDGELDTEIREAVNTQKDDLIRQIEDFDRDLDEVKAANGRSLGRFRIGQTQSIKSVEQFKIEAKRLTGIEPSDAQVKKVEALLKQKDEIISILAVERTNLENDKLDLATKKMILETEKLNLKEENERLKNGKSN